MANYVSGTSAGILDKNNSKKNNQKKRLQPGAKPASPNTAGLGLLTKPGQEAAQPSPLRQIAEAAGPLGGQLASPEHALASMALQRRTAQQNITPSGGAAGIAEEAERLSKYQKKRVKRAPPSPLAAV